MNFAFRIPETDAVLAAVRACAPKRLLDVGSGEGLITNAISSIVPVTATEPEEMALAESRRRCSNRVRFLQARPDALPFPSSSFDTAVCTQVIDHLKSPQYREAVLREIARVLRPDGKLVITVRHQNYRFDHLGMQKEGVSDGVFCHRFYLGEFRDQLEPLWKIERIHGVWVYLPKTYPIYTRLGPGIVYWEWIMRRFPFSLRYGKVLLAICGPK